MKRELIYMDAKSSKFWTIELEENSTIVTYGRTGSKGQTTRKNFAGPEAAQADFDKLVREKLGKGYVEAAAGEASNDGELPLVAFPSINQRSEIFRNAGTFIGQRVVDFDPEKPARTDVIYRFRSTYEDDLLLPHLKAYLATPAALEAVGLIIGAWQGDESDLGPQAVLECLEQHRERLPKLAALYVGDITSEENEISWITQGDLSGLLAAFPQLQLLRARGGKDLELSRPNHANLRGLALEAGGLDVSVIRSIATAELPKLEYLELWLGTEEYGATATVEDLQPILSGKLFPHLKYLGLRNSQIADAIAPVLVNSPLVQRLETLDLSLGALSDEGARALLKLSSPTLKKLNLHYNYISAELVKQLKKLPYTVDASRPSDMEEDEEWRFVAVGE